MEINIKNNNFNIHSQLKAAIAEIDQLKKINIALIERVESTKAYGNDSYAAFGHSVILAQQVRERTGTLTQVLDQLKISNIKLKEARYKSEIAHQYLVDAIESITDGFVLFDENRNIILFNRHFKYFWARHSSPVKIGMHLEQVKAIMDASGLIKEEVRSTNQRTLYRLTSERWLQVTERATSEGGLVILYTDITELKQREQIKREQELAKKSLLLQETVDNLSQGVAVVNQKGDLELWNYRFLQLYDFSANQANQLFQQIIKQNKGINKKQYYKTEQRLTNETVLDICTHPLPDGGYVATFTDITERYLHAQELRKSEQWLRLITDHVPAMIAYVNRDLTYEFVNKVYEQWYGWPKDMALGVSLYEAHGKEHMKRVMPYLKRALAGESVTFEVAENNMKDSVCYMQRSYVPNKHESGEIVGIFTLVRDITQRRRSAEALHNAYQNLEVRVEERTAELMQLNTQLIQEINERKQIEVRLLEAKREAEEANLSKTKFLAAVSHDLLQPLNAARLFTGALLEKLTETQHEQLMRSISKSLDDVESLLGTLVDISKLDAGVIKADIAAFPINELLESLAEEYRQQAESKGLDLHFIACSALVKSDINLLARILRNLLTNSIRYTSAGRILLGCRRVNRAISIQVWDTGIGISEEKRQEVFQEFNRGDWSSHQHDQGLGLGLAIVDKISRILNQPISLDSQLGKGSCFRILVPQADISELPTNTGPDFPMQPLDPVSDAIIWVLDNDLSICNAMHTLLSEWGCRVVTGVSKQDLFDKVGDVQGKVDLLIADYHLDHNVNGLDVVLSINKQRKIKIPILMITANYSNDLKSEMRSLGYNLLHKPVKPMRLKMAINHILEI